MQNYRVWTAGSKKEKRRGLSVKKQDLNLIVLELPEPRVDSQEAEGLKQKISSADRYLTGLTPGPG